MADSGGIAVIKLEQGNAARHGGSWMQDEEQRLLEGSRAAFEETLIIAALLDGLSARRTPVAPVAGRACFTGRENIDCAATPEPKPARAAKSRSAGSSPRCWRSASTRPTARGSGRQRFVFGNEGRPES